ncbi:lysophospholipase L1-like esterase [Pseudonocardia sediminis]|uniref:Lysophospholipase L1-like esterase n=1 Tax=Pseudonocardia sediminis TaxID=1397368 RepID=A0A4Q7UZ53_PSEST|nr:SGNH/GDSL hydrolase family protein [Pseudonocardia sediminis]RZT87427.1 lysophospholipase L1-like esterase [Pseudonocardia sediminis]
MWTPYYLNGFGGQAFLSANNTALGKLRAGLAARRVTPCRVVFVGSSTTEGYLITNPGARYVNQLAARLQAGYQSGILAEPAVLTVNEAYAAPSPAPGVHGYNAGASGTDSSTYLGQTARERIGSLNPRAVIHMIGSNDYANGMALGTYKANVAAQITSLKGLITGPCVHVLVHSYNRGDVASPANPWDLYGQALYELAAADPDNVAFIDLSRTMRAAGTPAADPLDLFASDLVHMEEAGHAFMADTMMTALGLPGAAHPRPQVSDSFNRPDSTTTMGATEAGAATWTTSSTWGITGKKAAPVSGASGNVFVETGLADLDATCVITYNGTAGLLFRASDDSNRLGVFLDAGGAAIALYKTDGGATSTLTSTPFTFTNGQDYVVRVVARGNLILVYINGVLRLTHTLSAGDQTKYGALTKCGFRNTATNTTNRWDGFSVAAA